MAFQTITKHGDIGADIREYLVPDEGKVFVQIDKSQAEARVVAALSEDYELLNAFDRVDIHRRTAALIFGYTTILDLSDTCVVAERFTKDSPERFMGKKTRHAGNYNMQKKRLMIEVTNDAKKFGIDIKISEWKAGKILDLFHNANPKIRGIFHRDVRAAIDERRVLINPFGRFRMFFERAGEELYKEAFAHIPQSTVHDSLVKAWLAVNPEVDYLWGSKEWLESGLDVVMEAHDSLTFLCREDEVVDICTALKREMEKPISFRDCTLSRDIDLVIPMDIEIGYENLKDLKKFKLPEEDYAQTS
jgi:DNA polymerase I-like protein with 3'-5' exonuclease and polymerase domains